MRVSLKERWAVVAQFTARKLASLEKAVAEPCELCVECIGCSGVSLCEVCLGVRRKNTAQVKFKRGARNSRQNISLAIFFYFMGLPHVHCLLLLSVS
jgi:hypothetical protein